MAAMPLWATAPPVTQLEESAVKVQPGSRWSRQAKLHTVLLRIVWVPNQESILILFNTT